MSVYWSILFYYKLTVRPVQLNRLVGHPRPSHCNHTLQCTVHSHCNPHCSCTLRSNSAIARCTLTLQSHTTITSFTLTLQSNSAIARIQRSHLPVWAFWWFKDTLTLLPWQESGFWLRTSARVELLPAARNFSSSFLSITNRGDDRHERLGRGSLYQK